MEFQGFQKIARLSRGCCIMEKIDGTNAQICITEDGEFLVGSRTRWITPEDDNYGFARWAHEHKNELMLLGPGQHFGEWWGQGIQRKYGLTEKRFSLFNTHRWCEAGVPRREYPTDDPRVTKMQEHAPMCCHVVPVLYRGMFETGMVDNYIAHLVIHGSHAAPGFMNPEGVVVYHTAANMYFKKTLVKDEEPKTKQKG